MNDSRIHRKKKFARDDSADMTSAAVSDVAFHSTHREGYQSKLLVQFTRRATDVISEVCCTVMTGDRHDKPVAMDLSMIAVALTCS